jgi:CubicO group peptidase (beta-lactamase class C family)
MTLAGVRCALFTVFLLAAPVAGVQASDQRSNLAGVWEAQRNFGPELRGRLTIIQRNNKWSAQIGEKITNVIIDGRDVNFEFPDGQGKYSGHFENGNHTISGEWVQAGAVMLGNPVTFPVTLVQTSHSQWRGELIPLDDHMTMYLVINPDAEGSLHVFLRNPERNLGKFLDLDRLEAKGNSVSLYRLGKDGEKGAEAVHGTYDSNQDLLSLDFPDDGGTYQFKRAGPASKFSARATTSSPYRYAPPKPRGDGWPTASLEDVGISQSAMQAFIQKIIDLPDDSVHSSNIHGVLMARHGKLVLEEYFHGMTAGTPHDTRSAAKSMTSVLVGAAMLHQEPISLATPVYKTMYGESLPADSDPRKQRIDVENLLTMTTGLDCNDSDPNSVGNEDTMQSQTTEPDWYRYTLNLNAVRDPGQESFYCSASPNLLGGVLAKATRRSLQDLFRELIAKPLHFGRYYMNLSPTGVPYMGGGIYFEPRDFMKLGQVLLNGGTWNGKQIVSAEWVHASYAPHYPLRGVYYGYLWWVTYYPYQGRVIRAFFAGGNGGQILMGVPDLDLLIEFWGGNYGDRVLYVPQRVWVPEDILPAVEWGK